jgi:alkylated DNA repair dioxygenase AlkB
MENLSNVQNSFHSSIEEIDLSFSDQEEEEKHAPSFDAFEFKPSLVSLSAPINTKKFQYQGRPTTRPTPVKDDDGGCQITPSMVKKHTPRRPNFRGQVLIDSSRLMTISSEPMAEKNILALQYNFLTEKELEAYVDASCKVIRFGGKSIHNSLKPRRDIGYTVDGHNIRYSNQFHPTRRYPPHTFPVLKRINQYLDATFPQHPFHELSDGLDILYSNDFERGGSVGSHADDERSWGIVAILSLGQTRWLRVRHRTDGTYHNIEMRHNSLTVMYGRSFQQLYTHQVDKLHADDIIHPRLSFNVRYLEGRDNLHFLLNDSDQIEASELSVVAEGRLSPPSTASIHNAVQHTAAPAAFEESNIVAGPNKRQKVSHLTEVIDLLDD